MDQERDHDYWINWIIADFTPFNYANKHYYLSTPSRRDRFDAERVYFDFYRDAINNGLYIEDEIMELLYKYKLWTDEKEKNVKIFSAKIEDIKVDMFNSYTRNDRIKSLRKELRDIEKFVNELAAQKSTLNNFTAKSIASFARSNYLISHSIFSYNKNKQIKVWDNDNPIISEAYKTLSNYILEENDYRELACSSIWKHIWGSRKGSNLFGRSAVDLSMQQKTLISWSNLYENVYKNSDCPPDRVIEDHDLLDGWMIAQKRKRETELNKEIIEGQITNPKILNSEEIYVVCDPDNIKDVYNLNDPGAKSAWNRRMSQIKKQGIVQETEMKDVQEKLRMKIAAAQAEQNRRI